MLSSVQTRVSLAHTEIQNFVGDGGLHSSGGWVPDRRQAASAVSIGHHLLRQLPASFPAKSRACRFPHRWPKAPFTWSYGTLPPAWCKGSAWPQTKKVLCLTTLDNVGCGTCWSTWKLGSRFRPAKVRHFAVCALDTLSCPLVSPRFISNPSPSSCSPNWSSLPLFFPLQSMCFSRASVYLFCSLMISHVFPLSTPRFRVQPLVSPLCCLCESQLPFAPFPQGFSKRLGWRQARSKKICTVQYETDSPNLRACAQWYSFMIADFALAEARCILLDSSSLIREILEKVWYRGGAWWKGWKPTSCFSFCFAKLSNPPEWSGCFSKQF